jgi:hypothetical protein
MNFKVLNGCVYTLFTELCTQDSDSHLSGNFRA